MKRIAYALVMSLALVAVLSTAALAHCGSCGTDKAQTEKKDQAKADCSTTCKSKAACSPAEKIKCASGEVKAACSDAAKVSCPATEAAMADMHKCCVKALEEGKGCCGKDADALKASFEEKVAKHQAEYAVKLGMHKCCAKALTEGKGCCGKDAEALKASYYEKAKKAAAKEAAKEASL